MHLHTGIGEGCIATMGKADAPDIGQTRVAGRNKRLCRRAEAHAGQKADEQACECAVEFQKVWFHAPLVCEETAIRADRVRTESR